ncbi:hypothetical protein SK128_005893 [Halocaridina rubra]|uniref:Uncharacterized protein n=1 Tax=Halocaridina rubra TaxID=373956 RepID=A0AAN9A7W0_HALRR
MEISLKSLSPSPPQSHLLQEPQRRSSPLPPPPPLALSHADTQLTQMTGSAPCRTARLYTIEDIIGRPQHQESSLQVAPQETQSSEVRFQYYALLIY